MTLEMIVVVVKFAVLVVTNLKPVKLMGYISEGMILFSDDNGKLVLIEAPEHVNPGVIVR